MVSGEPERAKIAAKPPFFASSNKFFAFWKTTVLIIPTWLIVMFGPPPIWKIIGNIHVSILSTLSYQYTYRLALVNKTIFKPKCITRDSHQTRSLFEALFLWWPCWRKPKKALCISFVLIHRRVMCGWNRSTRRNLINKSLKWKYLSFYGGSGVLLALQKVHFFFPSLCV